MEKKIKELEKVIKYNFKKTSLVERALTHKSYDNIINNEKLEFLGDRVLGLVISEKLLEKFPNEKEGIIDKKFANLVNKKTCSLIAKKINLKKFIILGISHKKLERSADKIISDCLEAIVGAIYLDGGLKSAEKFIFRFLGGVSVKIHNYSDEFQKQNFKNLVLKNLKNFQNMYFLKKLALNIDLYLELRCKYPTLKKLLVLAHQKMLNKMQQQNY